MSSRTAAFQSPLLATAPAPFPGLGFAQFGPDADLDALRSRMNRSLFALFDAELPAASRGEAAMMLREYCGGSDDFFSLFYPPVWSFLHRTPPTVAAENAMQAQALALFLHLWDDHLADGQLESNRLRVRMRAIAWHGFTRHCLTLTTSVKAPARTFERTAAVYAGAIRTSRSDRSMSEYCNDFRREIAIWTIVPYVCGFGDGGAPQARALRDVVAHFGVAWRLIDDLEDLEEDVIADAPSAVHLLLDATGREIWAACHAASKGEANADPATWERLVECVRANDHQHQLIGLANTALERASHLAAEHGWNELSRELSDCRVSADVD